MNMDAMTVGEVFAAIEDAMMHAASREMDAFRLRLAEPKNDCAFDAFEDARTEVVRIDHIRSRLRDVLLDAFDVIVD